jgi:hypothetical protein
MKKDVYKMKNKLVILFISLLLASCTLPQGSTALSTPAAASSIQPSYVAPTFTPSMTSMPSDTTTFTPTSTDTATFTPLPSDTSTPTAVSTQTGTPTQQNPMAVSKANSNCLFGPNRAYLYMYALTPGASAAVIGRNYDGGWLWVQPTGTKLYCWVAASLVTLSVNIMSIPVENPPLPTNPSVSPPTGVHATRSGSSVTISWNAAAPALQLAYLIEASICSKGNLLSVVVTTTNLSETLTDEKTCKLSSSGQLRVQNKLGYSTAVNISWP